MDARGKAQASYDATKADLDAPLRVAKLASEPQDLIESTKAELPTRDAAFANSSESL